MNEIRNRFDVLVVGGGLVGATFAALLAAQPRGAALRIGIVERAPFDPATLTEPFDPRVVALTEASRQTLLRAGVWTEQVATRACAYGHMEVRDSEGTGLIEFDCRDVHQPNLGHIVENAALVVSAQQQLAGLANVEVIYSSVTRLQRGGAGAALTLADGRCVEAPLLVAADGGNSFVRQQCGFRVRSWDYGHSAIIATVKTSQSNPATAFQWFTEHGPLAFLPLCDASGDRHYSSIVWSQQHAVAEELMALGDEAFLERLGRASEHRLGAVEAVGRRYCIPLQQRHAVDYVQPGVVLVGDAAHTIHPLAGQGVNLGFADVAALVEEIERGLHRGLPLSEPSVLKRYQRRRKPDNLAMMVAMEGFKRFFAEDNPALRILRNRGMSGLNELGPLKNQLVRRAMGF